MKNEYKHKIDLKKIQIRHSKGDAFIKEIESLDYRGYEVEKLKDGRKIVITKPGGKTVYGRPKKEDFLVYIFTPASDSLWQITHKQILEDLRAKSEKDPAETKKLILLLEKILNGGEPDDFLDEINALKFRCGETPEALIKVYKWIWAQEDVNYPNGEGRHLSWKGISALLDEIS
jgi:hypothetical protein